MIWIVQICFQGKSKIVKYVLRYKCMYTYMYVRTYQLFEKEELFVLYVWLILQKSLWIICIRMLVYIIIFFKRLNACCLAQNKLIQYLICCITSVFKYEYEMKWLMNEYEDTKSNWVNYLFINLYREVSLIIASIKRTMHQMYHDRKLSWLMTNIKFDIYHGMFNQQ